MKEAELVRRILQKLKTEYPHGVWYKIHTGPFQERGIPDILGCLNGWFVAFEVKLPTSKKGTTNYQKLQLDRINSAYGKAVVITSTKEALEFLAKSIRKLRPNHLQSQPAEVESTVEGEQEKDESESETSPEAVQEPKKKSKSEKRKRKKSS